MNKLNNATNGTTFSELNQTPTVTKMRKENCT